MEFDVDVAHFIVPVTSSGIVPAEQKATAMEHVKRKILNYESARLNRQDDGDIDYLQKYVCNNKRCG